MCDLFLFKVIDLFLLLSLIKSESKRNRFESFASFYNCASNFSNLATETKLDCVLLKKKMGLWKSEAEVM